VVALLVVARGRTLDIYVKYHKAGVRTPKPDMNLIEKRLKDLIEEREKRR